MNKRHQKIATFLFLILVSVPVCCPFIFILKQRKAQQTAASRLESEHHQTVYLEKNNLHWAKAGKELMIDGHLFDVKSITAFNTNLVKITGLFDNDETSLVKQIHNSQEKNNSENGKQLLQFLQLQLALPESNTFTAALTIERSDLQLSLQEPGLPTSVIDILTPPPQA